MATERLHELLPWYVNQTLDAEETLAFKRHIERCDACKEELRVLQTLKEELERHGEGFLADHPPPETLVALLAPGEEPLSAEDATAVRRHLAICATCAEESSWLKGEAVASVARPDTAITAGRVQRRTWSLMAGAAVAAVALFALVLVVRTSRDQIPVEVVTPRLVDVTKRAGEGRTAIQVPPETTIIPLYLETDFDVGAFPLTLEIQGPGGRTVSRRSGITARELAGGRFLFLDLHRRYFPDGDYVARLSGEAMDSSPPTEYPFRVISPAQP